MSFNKKPLIINLAITGNVPTTDDNPHVPITPEEIAEDAARCRDHGASTVHIHARDEDEEPVPDPDLFAEIIEKIRERCPEMIICSTTSGRVYTSFEQRSAPLELEGIHKPDMASLTLGSNNFAREASVNTPQMIQSLAERMLERDIVPELEVFELGMIDYSQYLLKKGKLERPLYYNLLLGNLGTLQATPLNLARMADALPENAEWGAAGIGTCQFDVNCQAITMGGHVRVGLEDNIWMDRDKTELATNPDLVKRVGDVATSMNRPVATPAQARETLGLGPPAGQSEA